MQTFLPYSNFEKTAQVLDDKRLNKQRIESYQILRAITDEEYGWQSHPAVNMWRGNTQALLHYALVMCHEWDARGGKDNTRLHDRLLTEFCTGEDFNYPWWLGEVKFHESHKANLYFKDPDHYGKFFDFEEEMPYWWPTQELEKTKERLKIPQ